MTRDEQGFTLVELLVAMSLMTIVLIGVLTTFDGFSANQRKTTERTEAQDAARNGIDILARDLRNAVSAGAPIADSVERAQADDLIFQTVGRVAPTTGNPSARVRARYCLNSANAANGRLVRQEQRFPGAPPALPSGTACPGPAAEGWTTTTFLATNVTNRFEGRNRPVFEYRFSQPTSTRPSELIAIMPRLLVDVRPGPAAPAETSLRTGVQLRNANQPPTVLFTVSVLARKLVLNATESFDPEQQPLRYDWKVSGPGGDVNLTGVRAETPTRLVGTHTVTLTVTDAANAAVTSEPRSQVINP